MDRLRKIVALLLLALWVPVTAHCKLETLSGLDFLACLEHADAVPHQDSDCKEDVCASVESGGYRVEDDLPLILPPTVILVLADLHWLADALWPEPIITDETHVPPELAGRWQFFCRTALPPRAPSLAS